MNALQANCPHCGGQINFKSGASIVVVCEFCRSAIARTDRALEDLGKVAELVETQSPLKLGLRGTYQGKNFELTGHAQLGHEAGGVWDEWYATFTNGWVGWLAEAQGRFYLTFYQPPPGNQQIPPFETLQLGAPVPINLGSASFVVAEKGVATALGAKGEIPYKLTPGERGYYADLSGSGAAFGTIDYSTNPPFMFVGREVSLADIGLASAKPAEREARRVSAVGISCPNCGGPLELRAPDQTERVTCPNCDSLLDVKQGNLKYLYSLKPPAEIIPFALEIGAVGTFTGDVKMTLIGAMTRSVTIEGTKYFFNEYLLYNPQTGFRWLVESDGHWSFVETVPPGEVMDSDPHAFAGKTIDYKGKTFKIFQDALLEVEHVRGEFYWRVEVGEMVRSTDYVKPPLMLSKEVTRGYGTDLSKQTANSQLPAQSGEINWSLGTYLSAAEVERVFDGKPNLAGGYGVAPNQPFRHSYLYKDGLFLLGVLFIIGVLSLGLGGASRRVAAFNLALPPLANADASQVIFTEPFQLNGDQNVEVSATAAVSNSYLEIDGDLINEETGTVQAFPLAISYYSGVEDGESWSEGSTSNSVTFSPLPAGRYTMRIDAQWEQWQQPMPLNLTVQQNVQGYGLWWIFFFLLLVIPGLALLWRVIFESRRWSESMFTTSGDDDE